MSAWNIPLGGRKLLIPRPQPGPKAQADGLRTSVGSAYVRYIGSRTTRSSVSLWRHLYRRWLWWVNVYCHCVHAPSHGGKDTLILNLGTRYRWIISFTLRPFHPQYALDRRLGVTKNRCGRGHKKLSRPCQESNPMAHPHEVALQLVTQEKVRMNTYQEYWWVSDVSPPKLKNGFRLNSVLRFSYGNVLE